MPIYDELRRYHEEIHRLSTENQELRRAAQVFGDLAERLNEQLRAERQRATTYRRPTRRDSLLSTAR